MMIFLHEDTYSSKSPKPPWSFPPNGEGPPGEPKGAGPPSNPSIGPSFQGPEKKNISEHILYIEKVYSI